MTTAHARRGGAAKATMEGLRSDDKVMKGSDGGRVYDAARNDLSMDGAHARICRSMTDEAIRRDGCL